MADGLVDSRIQRARRHVRSVRGRSALIAAGIVFLALLVGDIASVTALRSSLTDNLDQTLLQQAQDRAALIDDGTDPASLTGTLQEESLVWIGMPDGTAVAVGSSVVPLESPVQDQLDGVSEATLLVEENKPDEIETERMELRLASATTADGLIVIVGAETEVIGDTITSVVTLFAIATPLVTLLVGGLAWATVGRALRPVDAIRQETLNVSGSSLSARVPVPAAHDEIHDLATTMNDMLDRLEQHHQTLRRFTSDASHELKSPVANLRALVDTTELDDAAWPELRERLTGEADRLRDLVENLLFLATSDDPSAAAGAVRRRVDVDELAFGEAELLAATGRVRIDLSGVGPAAVIGDERALHRLVRNLADNAARHASTTVWFGVDEGEDAVLISIGDDGPGIDVAERDRVFERFTRLDDARDRDGGGAGLGLAIVRRIVETHGGTITIGDHPSGGADVTVTIPTGR